jgi:simple sugar transport system ATP-binding protein
MDNNNIVLKMRGVKKYFGATKALRGVDLDICKAEVHAIVGSNGAGKSTLMKTLAGEYIPNEGKVLYLNKDITGMSPLQIQQQGIEVVHQVLNIVDSMSILENILLACPPSNAGFLSWKKGEEKVKSILDFIGIELDLSQSAGSLSISEKQFVILARAIISNPQVLVLDEPTSRIGLEETEKLFALIEKLKENGTTIIYISHRMEEIYRICDKISVFRDGERIETRNTKDFPEEELVAKMLGQKLDTFYPKRHVPISDNILEVIDLHYKDKVDGVSFNVRHGEIVSLVGAVGAGKTEIINSIYGILKPDKGDIIIDDESIISRNSPKQAIRKGVALVPEDRASQGMIGEYSVKNNVTSINMDNIKNKWLLDFKKEDKLAQQINDKLLVHPNDINYTIKELSGGNQQKIVVGKWLIDNYKLYLLDEVAAGVDIGAKSEIYKLLGELVKKGAGIILSTGDIEEAIGLSDRIFVLYNGKIIKEVDPKITTKDEILAYIMGGGKNERKYA